MRSVTLISALLLCCWISVSVCESHTVEIQPGEEVTLMYSNISTSPTHTFWSRLINRTKSSCISSMYGSNGDTAYCEGFQNGKYKMSSNISTIFLTIKQVDFSDSGLYLCGFYINGNTVLNVVDLNVQADDESRDDTDATSQKEPDGITKLTNVILGVVTVFLLMIIIVLAVKYRKLQTAHTEEHNPQNTNLASDDLNYAALSFHPKAKRNLRPASERDLEPHVVYAATR